MRVVSTEYLSSESFAMGEKADGLTFEVREEDIPDRFRYEKIPNPKRAVKFNSTLLPTLTLS